jgi:hypothetical protein
VATLIGLIGLVVIWLLWRMIDQSTLDQHWWSAYLALFIGASVGAAELVSRYRDEPVVALAQPAGGIYLAIMGLTSFAAYLLLINYTDELVPAAGDDQLLLAIIAGFGAMALLRSKFFTLRTDQGDDIALGPDAAVSAFLNAADRNVDRHRADQRLDLVMKETAFPYQPTRAKAFLEIQLAAFQNLSEGEKREFKSTIDTVFSSGYSDRLKLQAISYGLLNVTGEDTYRNIIDKLKKLSNNPQEEAAPTASDGGPDPE